MHFFPLKIILNNLSSRARAPKSRISNGMIDDDVTSLEKGNPNLLRYLKVYVYCTYMQFKGCKNTIFI